MAKKLNIVNPIDDDINDEVQPTLDMSKPLGPQANERTFGKVDIPDAGRQVAKPIALSQIVPDSAQPRREVPLSVRRYAKEQNTPEWEMWHRMAEHLSGQEIPLQSLLRGEGDTRESEDSEQPVVSGFMALVSLAASIYRDGLANPITVMARGLDRYVIETGERRYQAYHLLYGVMNDEKFAKIPARVVDKADVWRQAAENSARRPLNAIGTARQLALLLMDLYQGKDGLSLLDYHQMIQDGESDRAFYAQVANGNVYRVPKGFGDRILQASGLKSKAQLSQYRDLLDLPDDLWIQADEEDWPERRIREELEMPVKTQDRLTMVNLSSKKTQSQPAPTRDAEILFEPPTDKFLKILQHDESKVEAYINQVEQWLTSLREQYLKKKK